MIPLTVIEELDGLKTRMDDVGRSARHALRSIEELRRKAGGSLKDPTPINGTDTSGTVQIEVNGIQNHLLIEHGLDPKVPDNRIIGAALGQAGKHFAGTTFEDMADAVCLHGTDRFHPAYRGCSLTHQR